MVSSDSDETAPRRASSGDPSTSSGTDAYRDPGDLPIVGLTTYLEQAKQGVWDVRASFLPARDLDAVTASGGVAVLLPPQPNPDAAAAAVLDGLDGLILTGGRDVQPELYGAERDPHTDAPRPDRDAWELALFRGAEERGIPVFAICRGLQLVNVARGGTLLQHLPEALGTERYRVGGGVFATNSVEVSEESRLAGLVGVGELQVHSYHHQGVDRLGDGLVPTARTDDGLVQAIEDPDGPYLVGVQWHPEENAEDRRLFLGLVSAASAFRAARTSDTPVVGRASPANETKRPDVAYEDAR